MRLAVLGHPVGRSRSPAMHNAALASLGLSGRYRAIDVVDRSGLAPIAEAIRCGDLSGANITMPHKVAAFELSDHVTPAGRRARAVNTWLLREGALLGENTDVSGIRKVASRLSDLSGVTILGAGGAARGALVAFEETRISLMARSTDAARELLDTCGVEGDVIPWGNPPPGSIVINCTPLGSGGEMLPGIDAAVGLIDMAYGPTVTPAVRLARSNGIPVADGIDVLVAQAAAAFELWTGREAPTEVMENAARNASRA